MRGHSGILRIPRITRRDGMLSSYAVYDEKNHLAGSLSRTTETLSFPATISSLVLEMAPRTSRKFDVYPPRYGLSDKVWVASSSSPMTTSIDNKRGQKEK